MLYIEYLMILDGHNVKKKLLSKIAIFELPRLENKQAVPQPPCPPSPLQERPLRVKNTQRGSRTCFT